MMLSAFTLSVDGFFFFYYCGPHFSKKEMLSFPPSLLLFFSLVFSPEKNPLRVSLQKNTSSLNFWRVGNF